MKKDILSIQGNAGVIHPLPKGIAGFSHAGKL
jgi:hypothetical protein